VGGASCCQIKKTVEELSQELSRATGALSSQCDYRIGNLAQEFEAKLKRESESRVAGMEMDRTRINELQTQIAELDKRFKASAG